MTEIKELKTIMLTGGRSIPIQHSFLKNYTDLSGSEFYFTDERCVEENGNRSNYQAQKNYFLKNYKGRVSLNRIEADSVDLESACLRYSQKLPNNIDLLFVSMGDDGHIASIFPYSSIVDELSRKVVTATDPYTLEKRVTITPAVINSAREVIVFALGEEKQKFYEEVVLRDPSNILEVPARIVINRTWIFDDNELGF